MNEPQNILIVRTDRIGDVILTLPLASIIKQHFKNAKVSLLVHEYTKSLAENNPYIDEVITVKERDGNILIKENVDSLKNKFDACIVAFPTYSIALVLFLSGIKIRIGSGYRWFSFFFNKKVYEHRKYGERHELEYNVRLLQHLGINYIPEKGKVNFGIVPSKSAKEKILKELFDLGIDKSKKLVIVHPGSGGSAIDLPKQKLKEIVHKVSEKNNVVVLITGSTKEMELCNWMVVNENIINTAGKYNLEELIALISNSDILIANSTGPIHIAAALNKYVIGFYPKFAAVSPTRWGPYTNKAFLFQPSICNDNCNRKKCEKLNCMDSINVNDVVFAIDGILSEII